MRMGPAFAIGFALVGSNLSAAEPDAGALTPSSPWNLNYADDYCRLARSFGSGDEAVFVVLDRFRPGPDVKLVVAGDRFRNMRDGENVEVRFGPGEEAQKAYYFAGDLGKGRPALVFRSALHIDELPAQASGATDSPSPTNAAPVRELIIGPLSKPKLRITLGPMRASLAALHKCMNELLVRWGADPAIEARIAQKVTPIGHPAQWVSSSDYPKSAQIRGERGMVSFRLTVDEKGLPSGCHIQQSTRPPEFDSAICRAMMKRARFNPALDREGKPVPSFYLAQANFVTR